MRLHRDVFWWVPEEDRQGKVQKPHATISVRELMTDYGVPASEVLHFVSHEIHVRESCLSLPLTLLLVISYAAMVILHDSAFMVNAVEDSLVHDIEENANFAFSEEHGHKNMLDVNSHADFWSWMSRGFVPHIFAQEYHLSEKRSASLLFEGFQSRDVPRADRGLLMHYNRIALGVRLAQERHGDDPGAVLDCGQGQRLQRLYNKSCVRGLGDELEPEMYEARRTSDPRRIEWLYIHDDVAETLKTVLQLEKSRWLDEKTTKVEVAFASYNGEYGLHTLIMCNFFWSRGGRVWKAIIPQSSFADWHMHWYHYVVDAVWFFCIVIIIGSEFQEVYHSIFEDGVCGAVKRRCNFWSLVDWASVTSAIAILLFFAGHQRRVWATNRALAVLAQIDEVESRSDYRRQGVAYFEALRDTVEFLYFFRLFSTLYIGVIALRLFKAFHAQPRLSLVTTTLSKSAVDLGHFMIVFCSVFCMYAVGGVVLFGRETATFTTIWRSFNTCFRMIQGEFDWTQMREIGRLDAAAWFVPFSVLVIILLMNMLIAIIMDQYSEVTASLKNSESIWAEAVRIVHEWMSPDRRWIVDLRTVEITITRFLKEQAKLAEASEPPRQLAETSTLENINDSAARQDGTHSKSSGGTSNRKWRSRTSSMSTAPEQQTSEPSLDRSVTMSGWKSESTKFTRQITGGAPPADAIEEQGRLFLMKPGNMKTLFAEQGIDLKKSQREDILQNAIKYFYNVNKEQYNIDDVLVMVGKIDHRTRKLKRLVRWTLKTRETNYADHNLAEVADLHKEFRGKVVTARNELAGWLPYDPEDKRLSEDWLDWMYGREAAPSKQSAGSVNAAPAPRDSAVLAATSVLVKRRKEDQEASATESTKSGVETNDKRLESLEHELQEGREVVKEALQAVQELHERYTRLQTEHESDLVNYKQLKSQAHALTREVRANREKCSEGLSRLTDRTQDRDEHYAHIKELIKESQDLQVEMQAARAEASKYGRYKDEWSGVSGASSDSMAAQRGRADHRASTQESSTYRSGGSRESPVSRESPGHVASEHAANRGIASTGVGSGGNVVRASRNRHFDRDNHGQREDSREIPSKSDRSRRQSDTSVNGRPREEHMRSVETRVPRGGPPARQRDDAGGTNHGGRRLR